MAHSPEIKARALEWRAAGQTFEAIAAELSVGIGTIYRWCRPDQAATHYETYREKWAGTDQERDWKRQSQERHAARLKAEARARQQERTAWLDNYRRSRGCLDCGTSEGKMDLDHRPGEIKLFDPGNCANRTWEAIYAEVAKCDVRCGSCHSKRHWRIRREE